MIPGLDVGGEVPGGQLSTLIIPSVGYILHADSHLRRKVIAGRYLARWRRQRP